METLVEANHALSLVSFGFYLESHWQLNDVEVNIVQLQDLQGFLQRGTHQLRGVTGIPQLGKQAQVFFLGSRSKSEHLPAEPPLTHTVLSFCQSLLCTVQDKGEGTYPGRCRR